jgi:3-oxoacyl-[acyl-carrier protein] reductase
LTSAITFDFSAKTVLITGGTQGIGLAIANGFRQSGACVHITGTRSEPARYDGDLSGFTYHHADFIDSLATERLASEFPRLDVLINNAGTAGHDEDEPAGFRRTIEVNLIAPANLSFALFPTLKASRGCIVNVGSVASFLSLRHTPAYTASKSGLLGLTRAMADRWAIEGVRVNLVAPGFIDTRMISGITRSPESLARLTGQVPSRSLGQPQDVAHAAMFLASPEAQYITGQSLVIDGGMMLR